MAVEIERKFLVKSDQWHDELIDQGAYCIQGYLLEDPNKTIRIRIMGTKAFLTIKGATHSISRSEYEYEIPVEDAKSMIESMTDAVIEKTRYFLKQGEHIWEIDVFHGLNEGLIVAEIELKQEDETFELPAWVDKEVSDDPRYFNVNLLYHPFKNWK
jgi:adenylate cyclase